ncbi:MAG: hypothetical protein PHU73_04530, partial [Patescibacteria group bacterium]|nr:hypothetical protein [Patescibacteria group bacterium]
MKESIKKGIYFGIASGVITTLGLMVGLNSTTGSKLVVLGGIFTIAIADALSDALGMHLSEESTNNKSNKEIWESTIFTFLSKLFIALSFTVAVLIFPLTLAVYINIVWGAALISFASYKVAREQMVKPMHV